MKVGRVVYPRTRLTGQKLLIKSAPLNQQLSQNQKIKNHVDQKVFSSILLACFVKLKLKITSGFLKFLGVFSQFCALSVFKICNKLDMTVLLISKVNLWTGQILALNDLNHDMTPYYFQFIIIDISSSLLHKNN